MEWAAQGGGVAGCCCFRFMHTVQTVMNSSLPGHISELCHAWGCWPGSRRKIQALEVVP